MIILESIILKFFVFVFRRTQNEDLRKEIKDMEKSFREKVTPKLFISDTRILECLRMEKVLRFQ